MLMNTWFVRGRSRVNYVATLLRVMTLSTPTCAATSTFLCLGKHQSPTLGKQDRPRHPPPVVGTLALVMPGEHTLRRERRQALSGRLRRSTAQVDRMGRGRGEGGLLQPSCKGEKFVGRHGGHYTEEYRTLLSLKSPRFSLASSAGHGCMGTTPRHSRAGGHYVHKWITWVCVLF